MSTQSEEQINIDLTPQAAHKKAQEAVNPSPVQEKLVPREETIFIKYTDPDGVIHEAAIVSRIMTGQDKTLCDLTAVNLAGGHKIDNLPSAVQMRYVAMARLEVQLRPCPNWLSKWASEDDVLLLRVFEKLEAHNLRYFRRDIGTGDPAKVDGWLSVNTATHSVSSDT
jgi:hypothetical protein